MLRIIRKSQLANRMRAYKVILDGQSVGEVRNGEDFHCDLSPGKHRLQLKVDWCGSNVVEFEVQAGQSLAFSCGCILRGWLFWVPFSEVWYTTFARNKFLWIEEGPAVG